jgi:hypothetical protein
LVAGPGAVDSAVAIKMLAPRTTVLDKELSQQHSLAALQALES